MANQVCKTAFLFPKNLYARFHANQKIQKIKTGKISHLFVESLQSTQHSGRLSSAAVEQRAPNDRFWLFFTRVKNYVTERQILEFVTDSLGTDDAFVKKLVPAWKDTLSMPYVSFKVGVDVRLKETALLPSTWPAGLRFREFREDVWEPL